MEQVACRRRPRPSERESNVPRSARRGASAVSASPAGARRGLRAAARDHRRAVRCALPLLPGASVVRSESRLGPVAHPTTDRVLAIYAVDRFPRPAAANVGSPPSVGSPHPRRSPQNGLGVCDRPSHSDQPPTVGSTSPSDGGFPARGPRSGRPTRPQPARSDARALHDRGRVGRTAYDPAVAFKRGSGAKRRKRKPHRRGQSGDQSPPAPVTVRFVDPAELQAARRPRPRSGR